MTLNLNSFIDRRHQFDCAKWTMYPEEVIPLWVADMDFRSPEPVIKALHERVDHGIFGYQGDAPELRSILIDRLHTRHKMDVTGEQIVFMPGLVFGLNTVGRTVGAPGTGVLMNTPIYPPFIGVPKNNDRLLQTAPLASSVTNSILHYEIDFDALEAAVTPETRMFMLCNPHNPVGRVYSRKELEALAEFCLRHDLILCADEIHCDLVYPGGAEHISIASLSPEMADRTVTLLAPSKTFNLPGFGLGFAVIQNEELRKQVVETLHKIGAGPNALSYTAAEAAYRDGQPWLDEVLAYLQGNRDALVEFVQQNLPELSITQPEGTYLAWIDCRPLNLQPDPYQFFLDNAHVAFSGGAGFEGPGFIRVNYATTRDTLMEGMNRAVRALGREVV